MREQGTYPFMQWNHQFLLIILIAVLLTSCAQEKVAPAPQQTATPAEIPAWRQVEEAISQALLETPDGKCEWEVWGWRGEERYLWALCQAGAGFDAPAASLPLVVREASDGAVEVTGYPEEGPENDLSVKRLFPPAVQEKITANDFDLASASVHLLDRWNYPAMPPAIFIRADDPLPTNGQPAVPAINVGTASQVEQAAVLGEGNIKTVLYLPDGQIVVSGDRGMGYLDIDTGRIDYQFEDMLAGGKGFLSSDGKLLAAVHDQTVEIYEMDSRSMLTSIDTNGILGVTTRVHFLPDGMTIIVEKTIPASDRLSVQLGKYKLGDGSLLDTWWIGGKESVISPDGKVGVGLFSTWQMDVWSVYTTEYKYSIQVIPTAVSFSGDSQIMAVVSLGTVHLYWVWDGFEIGSLQKGVGNVSGAALSPDGKLILTWSDGFNPARVWTVPDFQPVATLEIDGVSAAAFNQDGSLIALAGDTAVAQYNVATGEFIMTPGDTYTGVTDLSFAPDRTFSQGQRLAVAYNRGIVANWDVDTQKPLFVREEYVATSLVSASEPYGIAIGTANRTVEILDAGNGSLLHAFAEMPGQVTDLALGPANQLVAGSLQQIRVYSLANTDDKRGRKVSISDGWVEAVTWPCFLAVKTAEGRVKVLNDDGEKVGKVLSLSTYGYDAPLAASRDCSQLWAANYLSVYRWDAATWEQLTTWKLDSVVSALAVSQDGTLAAVGLMDGSIRLLDSGSSVVLSSIQGHNGQVTALEFSPDGRFLASGGTDGVVILWNAK